MNNPSDLNVDQLPEHVQAHINKLERMRRDFVANVSHELRTPLTVFKGYLEMLTHQTDIDTKTLNDIYQHMEKHSNRMEHIINDLLLLSHLEHNDDNPLQTHPINMSALIDDTISDLQPMISDKQHTISTQTDNQLTLDANPEEIKSLLTNLIMNAIKYTPAHGHIDIQWAIVEQKKVISVIDNGMGIDAMHIPRLTERFYRADKARSRDQGGTGLGLAIVKHVLIRHQGTLDIQSKIDVGSVFRCFF